MGDTAEAGPADIKDSEPGVKLRIDRVGVRGIRTRFPIKSPWGTLIYEAEVDAYVELPPDKRGVHMSRNIEAFAEVIYEARLKEHPTTVEGLLAEVAEKLLKKHDYTQKVEVVARTAYFFDVGPRKGFSEPVDVVIRVVKSRSGEEVRELSISLLGLTVCPCAQMTFSLREGTELHKSPSHTQRARLTATITLRNTDKAPMINELAELLVNAFSAPVVGLLKRDDEYKVVKEGFEKPRFIEDVVRHALDAISRYLVERGFPPDARIKVEVESYESIHPYNAYACREATLEELLSEASPSE